MSDEKKEPVTDHDYDGIQELDNSLPGWWLKLFYLTILFAVGYFAYYELGGGPTLIAEFESALAEIQAKHATAPARSFPDAAKLVAFAKEPTKLGAGKAVFQARCVSCHGDKGQGLIGPNLTDDYWLHGDGKINAIAKVISEGVAEKGMPPWGAMLSEEELYAVAVYVKSLRGTNPPGAKSPQGTLYKE